MNNFRFGKRSEVEIETPNPNSSPYKLVGPKDAKWLTYYMRLPSSVMARKLAGEKFNTRQVSGHF